MNTLFIGSTIEPETQTMTAHYDGSIIKLVPICNVDKRIEIHVLVNDKLLVTVDPTGSQKVTFPGNTIEHTLYVKNKLEYDKHESAKCMMDADKITCSIDKIPLHHTTKDPSVILNSGYSGVLLFLGILASRFIMTTQYGGWGIVSGVSFGMLATIVIASFFLYKRHHVLALSLALGVMALEVSDWVWAVLNHIDLITSSDDSFKVLISIFLGRGVAIWLTVRGLFMGIRIADLNREIHNKLATTS